MQGSDVMGIQGGPN